MLFEYIDDDLRVALFIAGCEAGRWSHDAVEMDDILVGLAYSLSVRKLLSSYARPGSTLLLPQEDILRRAAGAVSEPDPASDVSEFEALLREDAWTYATPSRSMLPLSESVLGILNFALLMCWSGQRRVGPIDVLTSMRFVGGDASTRSVERILGATPQELRLALGKRAWPEEIAPRVMLRTHGITLEPPQTVLLVEIVRLSDGSMISIVPAGLYASEGGNLPKGLANGSHPEASISSSSDPLQRTLAAFEALGSLDLRLIPSTYASRSNGLTNDVIFQSGERFHVVVVTAAGIWENDATAS